MSREIYKYICIYVEYTTLFSPCPLSPSRPPVSSLCNSAPGSGPSSPNSSNTAIANGNTGSVPNIQTEVKTLLQQQILFWKLRAVVFKVFFFHFSCDGSSSLPPRVDWEKNCKAKKKRERFNTDEGKVKNTTFIKKKKLRN